MWLLPSKTQTATKYPIIPAEKPYLVYADSAPYIPPQEPKPLGVIEQSRHPLGNNCVKFARATAKKSLPQGLFSLNAKKSAINQAHPCVDCVAVTAEGKWSGHLSVVREIESDTIVIEEGNYKHGYRTLRRIKKSIVLGYVM